MARRSWRRTIAPPLGLLMCTNVFACAERADDGSWRKIDEFTPASEIPPLDLGGPVAKVEVGHGFSCALLQDGRINCFGANDRAQLGHGHTEPIGDDEPPIAGLIEFDQPVVDIDVGAAHVCVVLADGTLRCWGAGDRYQLGFGDDQDLGIGISAPDLPPVPMKYPDDPLVAVATGEDSTCVVGASRESWCWGKPTTQPEGKESSGVRPRTHSYGAVTRASVGSRGACFLFEDRQQYLCLPYGSWGRAGNPGSYDTGHHADFCAGDDIVCEFVIEDRSIRCISVLDEMRTHWEYAYTWDFEYPTIKGDIDPEIEVGRLDCGADAVCTTFDGEIFCAGTNRGQLGFGRKGRGQFFGQGLEASPAVHVSTGPVHGCGTYADGTAKCWGDPLAAGNLYRNEHPE